MKKLFILVPLLGLTAFAHAGHGSRDLVSATADLERVTYNVYQRIEYRSGSYADVEKARKLARAARKLNRAARHRAPRSVLLHDFERVERRFYRLKRELAYSGNRWDSHRVSWSSNRGFTFRPIRRHRGLQNIAYAMNDVKRALTRRVHRHKKGKNKWKHDRDYDDDFDRPRRRRSG